MNNLSRNGVGGGWFRMPAGVDLDAAVAIEVFGWNERNLTAAGAPPYSTDPGSMWLVVAHMATQMGYERLRYRWQGPIFKSERDYLTHESYGLGTTCWFVAVEEDGLRWLVCAETPMIAVCWAAREVLAVRAQAEEEGR